MDDLADGLDRLTALHRTCSRRTRSYRKGEPARLKIRKAERVPVPIRPKLRELATVGMGAAAGGLLLALLSSELAEPVHRWLFIGEGMAAGLLAVSGSRHALLALAFTVVASGVLAWRTRRFHFADGRGQLLVVVLACLEIVLTGLSAGAAAVALLVVALNLAIIVLIAVAVVAFVGALLSDP